MNDAWSDLLEHLEPEEVIESICFGEFGWGGFMMPENSIPESKIGVLLSPTEARDLMRGWSFNGGFGSPRCFAAYIWTDRNVFHVTEYDGATTLFGIPRNPVACLPEMSGGG